MNIFVNIASYRDPLLEHTIKDAYLKANNKDNIFFGVVDQSYEHETFSVTTFPFKDQIRYLRVDPDQTLGTCWARHIAQTFWNEEEYYLQVDSHMLFEENWDTFLIEQIQHLQLYHEKPVISSYPWGFEDVDGSLKNFQPREFSKTVLNAIAVNPARTFTNEISFYVNKLSKILHDRTETAHGFLVSAGYLFTIGKVVLEVPYDPYLIFMWEEQSLALRLWTNGYNIFHIHKIPVYHYYHHSYRIGTMWYDILDNKLPKDRLFSLQLITEREHNRVKQLFTEFPTDNYGIGKIRTVAQYQSWCGIDYQTLSCDNKSLTGQGIFDLNYKQQIG